MLKFLICYQNPCKGLKISKDDEEELETDEDK